MKNVRLIINILFAVSCVVIIFILSSQDKKVSGTNSLKVLTAVTDFISRIFNISINLEKITELHNFFRKTAHFGIYTALSVFSYNTFRIIIPDKKHAVTIAFIFCIIMSISDEIHQIFIPGRSAEFRDVGIDTLGVCCGLALAGIIGMIFETFKNIIKNKDKRYRKIKIKQEVKN